MPNNLNKNQGLQISNRREMVAENFSAWEQNIGRGWKVFDCEIELEPTFLRFIPPQINFKSIDDGRVPTLFGRFFSNRQNTNLISNDEVLSASNSVKSQPSPRPPVKTASFRIFLPNESKTSFGQTEQLLLNLAASAHFIGFEIIGDGNEIVLQITCPETQKLSVYAQLKSHMPNVDFRETEDVLKHCLQRDGANESVIVDFGLGREWFIPLPFGKSFAADPLLALTASLEEISNGETACLQIIFSRARQNWQSVVREAIFDRNGKLAFGNLQNYVSGIKDKLEQPLLTAQIRFAVQSISRERSLEIAKNACAFFRQFSAPCDNELIPLQNAGLEPYKHLQSILSRTTFRSGMFLSAQELSALVHLPSDAVQSRKMHRDENRTKLLPHFATEGTIVLGENHHHGQKQTIKLSDAQRVKHLWLTGSSGSGKTSLVNFLVAQDIEAGNGLTIIEPHGDSIENIIACIPEHRLKDVVLLDPGDEEFPIGFNILRANSELEKTLLSSDLVATFRRFSTSWGDVIGSVLHNAILAFLSSEAGGTIIDLRHFLADKNFRENFLKTVEDEELRFYWKQEFPPLAKSITPLLTRLNLFLRSKIIRNILAQKENKLDFRRMMDERKILLVKLTHGKIGEEHAHFLGSLVMTKLYQAALSRQNVPENSRVNHFIYLDEAHNFIVPSLALLLSGGRKFSCSLLFSHQETKQVTSRDPELLSSLQTNCFTRICFRTDSDAEVLAKGFSFFTAEHLKNLGVGEAICRFEQSRYDFNLKTFPLETVKSEVAEQKREFIIENTRKIYAKPKADIEAENQKHQPVSKIVSCIQSERGAATEIQISETFEDEKLNQKPMISDNQSPSDYGRGGKHHQELQAVIRRMAESYGFTVETEKSVSGGAGFVDVSLEKENLKIAVEVSVTSTSDYETRNILKCLTARYDFVFVVVSDQKKIAALKKKIQSEIPVEQQDQIKASGLTGLLSFLRELSASPKEDGKKMREKHAGQRLNFAEACNFFGIGSSTLYRWIQEGRVPFYRPGREYQFDREELVLIGRQDLSGKRKALVKLEPLKIEKKVLKGKKQQSSRYRKLLNLE